MKWYIYDITNLSDEEYKHYYSLMNQSKRRRVDSFRFVNDKKRTVAGEMLARKAIAEWCSVDYADISFGTGRYSKPFALDLAVEFNISHSGNKVVCVVDERPVGVDIEKIRPIDLSVAKIISIILHNFIK